ncbi:MAG: xanthine dehydrogenase family protein molybdopterin-binding subunit, partial [Streptosporangiaceae bacterium]
LALGPTRIMVTGTYDIPVVRYAAAAVVTNTAPMGACRGAGRPEAAELVERMMDIAALEMEVDPVALRLRNVLPPFTEPVRTAMGTVYDTGDYAKALEEAVRLAGYAELRAEQAARRAAGARWQLGIGIGIYVEVTARGNASELGAVEVHGDGAVTVRAGTSSHGQGHATAFSMIVADTLGIPLERIRYVQSDTAAVPRGGGTGGSRSLQLGGNAVLKAAEAVLDRARSVAAAKLEAAAEDIVVHPGQGLGVAGVPSTAISWGELSVMAANDGPRPGAAAPDGAPTEGGPLAVELDFNQGDATFPFGAHVSVVEVDTETGQAKMLRHVTVDDAGPVLNPVLAEGQRHGGIAQGAAQALFEEVLYDADGNPLTSTLADYAAISAPDLPSFELAASETPTDLNPLGAKGIGEAGTIGSTPAIQNAVIDAVSHLGVRHIDMPATPQRVWTAINAARKASNQ